MTCFFPTLYLKKKEKKNFSKKEKKKLGLVKILVSAKIKVLIFLQLKKVQHHFKKQNRIST